MKGTAVGGESGGRQTDYILSAVISKCYITLLTETRFNANNHRMMHFLSMFIL